MNPDDSPALCFGGAILAQLGDRELAIEWVERALDAAGSEAFIVYNSACTLARLGVVDRAFELLERAVDLGWGDRTWIEHDSDLAPLRDDRSEEHTSELQSLMRISYAVFCLKKKKLTQHNH